jgi:PAS domain S-box-containing protein
MPAKSTLNASLTPELQRLIDEKVASGHYRSASEVVRAALRLLLVEGPPNNSQAPQGPASHPDHQQVAVLFSQISAGMAQTDLTGRFVHANDQYCAIVGRSREELLQLRMHDITHPEDLPHNEARLARLVETGEAYAIEKRYVRPDGSVVWASNAVSLLRSPSGQTEGTVGVTIDISAQRKAETALRESQRRLNAVLDNASVSIFLMDEHQQCVYMNAAAETLTGYTLAETRGRTLHDVVHHTRPDGTHFPLAECPIDRAFPEDNQMQGEETFVHKDGSFYPVAFTASPIRDEDAEAIGTIIEVRGIRAEKQAQERQRLLINELNHRVKNTLTTVQSIASQSLRNAPTKHDAKDALEGRLIALSRVHDVLTQENWEGAELREIVAQAVEPYSGRGEDRLHLKGSKVRLSPRMALALAMALQELATNAVKYGALSNTTGEITITWGIDKAVAPARLHLQWEEIGGPPVQAPTHRGFGSRLIERSLAQELDGKVQMEFATTGVVCILDAPIA